MARAPAVAALLAAALLSACGPRPPRIESDVRPIASTDCSASAAVPCREVEIPEHVCPEGVMSGLVAEVRLSSPDVVEITGGAFQPFDVPMQDLRLVIRGPRGGIISVVAPNLNVTAGGVVWDSLVSLEGRGLGGVDFYLFYTCDDAAWEMDFPDA